MKVNVITVCRFCNRSYVLTVNASKYLRYKAGKMKAKDAFSNLHTSEQELFVSRVCGECWDEMFG